MSVVFIITPAIVGGWPVLMAAIAAATSAMGFRALQVHDEVRRLKRVSDEMRTVELDLPNAQLVAETLERDQSFTVVQDDVTITFSRDVRGNCKVHVDGKNKTKRELAAIGQQVMNRVLQQYAYNKVMTELEQRGFNVVKEEVDERNVIRIRVRRPA